MGAFDLLSQEGKGKLRQSIFPLRGKKSAKTPKSTQCFLSNVDEADMDGYETTRRIKAMSQYVQAPIVGITGNTTSEDIEKCFASGMVAVLAKPIDTDQLFEVLRAQLLASSTFQPQQQPTPAPMNRLLSSPKLKSSIRSSQGNPLSPLARQHPLSVILPPIATITTSATMLTPHGDTHRGSVIGSTLGSSSGSASFRGAVTDRCIPEVGSTLSSRRSCGSYASSVRPQPPPFSPRVSSPTFGSLVKTGKVLSKNYSPNLSALF